MTTRTIPEATNENPNITVKEGAALLRLSEVSIRRFLTQKKLRRYKVGGRTLLKKSEVLGLVREVK